MYTAAVAQKLQNFIKNLANYFENAAKPSDAPPLYEQMEYQMPHVISDSAEDTKSNVKQSQYPDLTL